jgi:hypothetical protein
MTTPKCAVPGCERAAVVEVILYDVYQYTDDRVYNVLYDQNYTCPYLCMEHLSENEQHCRRVMLDLPPEKLVLSGPEIVNPPQRREPAGQTRSYRSGGLRYPYTNRDGGNGFSVYRPLKGPSL